MKNSGKIIGIIMVAAGSLVFCAAGAWLIAAMTGDGLTVAGAVLGIVLALILIIPLVGVGIVMIVKGRQEEKTLAQVSRQRKLLDIVKTKGTTTISDLVLELDASYDQVKGWIYDLVGKGLFSGYVNWEEGTLFSRQASQLRGETKCKHCGGELSLAGKGVINCPYCGTEYFLS